MLRRRQLLSLLTAISLIFVGLGPAAVATESDEQGFLNKINAERTSRGLSALVLDTGLRDFARNQTQFMIDGNCPDGKSICHSTDLTKAAQGWSALGENVGRGGTVNSLHDAFMKSSGHRANILDTRWNYVGVGAKHNGESLYVTVVFMQKGSTGGGTATTTTTTPKPKTTTTTTPPTTTTTTTIPPTTTTMPPTTTTTTLIVGPDKAITPGGSCVLVTRFGWICKD